jgi:hypothetical protein
MELEGWIVTTRLRRDRGDERLAKRRLRQAGEIGRQSNCGFDTR